MGLRDRYLAAMQSRCAVATAGRRNTQHPHSLLRIASAVPVQRATETAGHATRHATSAQQEHERPRAFDATPDATNVQREPAAHATDSQFGVLRDGEPGKPDPIDLAAVAWTDADISAFLERRARLLRWGWAEPEAEKLAERLLRRDREHGDERVCCVDCAHYRTGRCGNHRVAGLNSPELGRDLAATLQRCPAFARRKDMP